MRRDETEAVANEAHARRWKVLGVLSLSLTIVMVGNSSLNVALPSLARSLDTSTSALQWVVDVYALVFAGLLFPAGAIGDRVGRRLALQLGLAAFMVGALIAVAADTGGTLVAARAVMGIGAAFVMPSTLSILTNVFPEEERGRAIAAWVGVAAAGAAVGPVGSGLLLEHFWWGSVFLVNVPVVAAAIVLGVRLVPESKDPSGDPLDVPGALLSTVAIGALVYGIIHAPEHGWSGSETLLAGALSLLAGAAFVARERSARHPMLEMRWFGDPRFTVAAGGIAAAFFAMFGTWFLVAQYVQLVLGFSPLRAGLLFLPFSAVMLLLAPYVPRLVARLGGPVVAALGLAGMAAGLAGYSWLDDRSGMGAIYLTLLPIAAGIALSGSPLTTLIMSAVPQARAGSASAMNDTTREVGGALGVAVLGSLTATHFASAVRPALADLTAPDRALALDGLPGALDVASRLPGAAGGALADASRTAFVDAFHLATLVSAVLMLVAAALVVTLLPSPGTRRAKAASVTSPPPSSGSPPAPALPAVSRYDVAEEGSEASARPDGGLHS